MLSGLTARKIIDWIAYSRIEPFGEERGDVRIAQLCCLVANALRPKGRPPARLEQFMPFRHVERQPLDWRVMKANMRAQAEAHNARQARRR